MNAKKSNCEDYEPLISALIDGELEPNERNELNSHLQNCIRCKQQVIRFEQVDAAVTTLARDATTGSRRDESIHSTATRSPAHFPTQRHPMSPLGSNSLSIWRLIPLAVAATLLVCLGIAIWPNPNPVRAEISPAQIVEPMKELHLLNQQKQRDQDLMLRTLGMDLRSMKLEINLLEPGSVERVSLAEQIDAMIDKVKRFESLAE